MIGKLPGALEFFISPEAAIYLPGQTRPTIIRGGGYVTYWFKPTEQHDLLDVGLQDMHLRLDPFILPVNMSKGLQGSCLEVGSLVVDASAFDLDASVGTLNLETGKFEMTFEYVFTSKQIPLLEKLGDPILKFSAIERGYMDIKQGTYEIHAGVLEIKEGPLAGALIRNHGPGIISSGDPSVDLTGVIYYGINDCKDIPDDRKTKTVTICPGDQVLLCWTTSGVSEVVLDPGSLVFDSSTTSQIVTPVRPVSGPPEVLYVLKGVDEKVESSVKVRFYDGEWLGPYHAQRASGSYRWELEIPVGSVSGRLEVREIQLVHADAGCIDWPRYLLEHIPEDRGPGGAIDFGSNIEGFAPIAVGPFRAAGYWYFSPIGDALEGEQRDVCFMIRGACAS